MSFSSAGFNLVEVDVTSTSSGSPTPLDSGGHRSAIFVVSTSNGGSDTLYSVFADSTPELGTTYYVINSSDRPLVISGYGTGPIGAKQGLMFIKASDRWHTFPYDT